MHSSFRLPTPSTPAKELSMPASQLPSLCDPSSSSSYSSSPPTTPSSRFANASFTSLYHPLGLYAPHSKHSEAPPLTRQKPYVPLESSPSAKRASKENFTREQKRVKRPPLKRKKVIVMSDKLDGRNIPAELSERYLLGDELGSGGFGFVMSATRYSDNEEVAVKFIYRSKIPRYSWINDPVHGAVPTELYVLLRTSRTPHQSIIRLHEYFADAEYFILVTELHGTPWSRTPKKREPLATLSVAKVQNIQVDVATDDDEYNSEDDSDYIPSSDMELSDDEEPEIRQASKRESHDLFEMIETRGSLSERQIRYIMRQLVDALWYLDSLGIYHRDIKDENVLIDDSLKIKLIDFGSAIVLPVSPPTTPTTPRTQFNRFYGTLQYAPVEVLKSQPYDAEKCDVWALGIMIYTCLTGNTPFRSAEEAINNIWVLKRDVSQECRDFIGACLEKDPQQRATIYQLVRERWWLVDLP